MTDQTPPEPPAQSDVTDVEPSEPAESLPYDEPTAPRRKIGRTVTAGVAGLVLLISTVGYAAVSRYTGEVRHIDVFSTLNEGERPADEPGTNLLLVGTDQRSGLTKEELKALHVGTGNYGPPRTDTVMLLHISADQNSVSVVSLLRDSYVTIPSYTDSKGVTHTERKNKLNAAYEIGGAPLLVRTVEDATGVRIDHFVEMNFAGFLSMVDAIGGVPVCVTKATIDKASGLNLPAGTSVVTGKQALAYVRARKIDTDIGRANRQQKFIASIVQKATSSGTLLNPLALNAFLDAATSSVTTDNEFDRDGMLALGNRLRSINSGDIIFLTVPIAKADYRVDIGKAKNQSTVLWSPDAKDLFSRINADLSLTGKPAESDAVTAVRIAPSRVRVKVYNATATSGLGRRVADDLAKAGYTVVGQPQNAKANDATTTVIQYDPAFDQSLKTLRAAFPNAAVKKVNGLGNTFLLQVGSDYNGVQPVTVSATAAGPSTAINSPTKVHSAADSICG